MKFVGLVLILVVGLVVGLVFVVRLVVGLVFLVLVVGLVFLSLVDILVRAVIVLNLFLIDDDLFPK